MTVVDADKSEFFAEPGITIPLKLTTDFSNTYFVKSFQVLHTLNTKLGFVLSMLTLDKRSKILLVCLLDNIRLYKGHYGSG